MRTGSSSRLSKLCLMFPLIVLIIGYTTTSASAAMRSASLATDAHMEKEAPDFSKFAGFWHTHIERGSDLTIQANGQAHFAARTYTWCGPGVQPPCDSIQGNYGYQTDLRFSRVAGDTAYGTVISGNIQSAGSPATVKLLPDNQLFFSAGMSIGSSHLCGPNAPVGACGA